MLGELKVLHVNIGERKAVRWSLFCNESLADLDALAVVELYVYENLDTGEPAFPVERKWQLFEPSTKQEREARCAYRAALWMNKKHNAQQFVVTSSDVVAAKVPTKRGAALIVSAYDVKSTDGQAASEEQLRSKLNIIKDAYDRVKAPILTSGRGTQGDLLLCADSNRHHELSGGAQAFGEPGRTDEAEPIIDFIQENALTSLLSSGTVTWEHYNGSTCSTIDLLLATSGLSEVCGYCGVHPIDHGSDHKCIRAHIMLDTIECEEKRRKRMYEKADWKKVREKVSTMITDDSSLNALSTKDGLEVAADRLEAVVNGVLICSFGEESSAQERQDQTRGKVEKSAPKTHPFVCRRFRALVHKDVVAIIYEQELVILLNRCTECHVRRLGVVNKHLRICGEHIAKDNRHPFSICTHVKLQ
jgi:hypothetical protein